MLGEIIAIGNELTSGRILNTTSTFAARHLFEAGYDIYAMHTIGDTPNLIGEALQRALNRVDFIVVTGGLGATDDDMTTEAVSKALQIPTMPNLEILSLIRERLDELTSEASSQLEKLAWLPEGADPLNPKARMSGFLLEHKGKPIFFLPGIPHQMEQLLTEHVVPRLTTWRIGNRVRTRHRLYKVFNLTEVEVNQKIPTLKLPDEVTIGYYPVFPDLHLSLTVRDKSSENADKIFTRMCLDIEELLGYAIFGYDHDTMESVVGILLQNSGLTIATAESCTGGLISHKITTIPGSSDYFLGGVISYANSLKMSLLNVSEESIREHGAVSEEVARNMTTGIQHVTGADITIGVTGIAGPGGGIPGKPVGTVYIGMATPDNVIVNHYMFSGDRKQIQEITTQTGLDLVRGYLTEKYEIN